jgi:hypothetical protein
MSRRETAEIIDTDEPHVRFHLKEFAEEQISKDFEKKLKIPI